MKIGLITPYGGTNLGDAAIQEAVMHQIRKRRQDADIRLITLQPDITSALHGAQSFPINALKITHYSQRQAPGKRKAPSVSQADGGNANAGRTVRLKKRLRNHPSLFKTLKFFQELLKQLLTLPPKLVAETGHFFAARRFMKGSDLFMVSGGGQLDDYWGGPWGHPYSLFKWSLIARSMGARYVFMGVGTCELASPLSRFFIRLALRAADYRSYRDQASKDLLRHLPFTHGDAVCPDLAFGFEKARCRSSKGRGARSGKLVAISPIGYLRENWPKQNPLVAANYFESLVAFISTLMSQEYAIMLFATDSPDRHVVKALADHFAVSTKACRENGAIRHVPSPDIDALFAHLAAADYVVASRLHGILLSHLLGIPVLAISYDRKVDTYMDDTGFDQFCLGVEDINATALSATFQNLVADADTVVGRLDALCTAYADQVDAQFERVMEAEHGRR